MQWCSAVQWIFVLVVKITLVSFDNFYAFCQRTPPLPDVGLPPGSGALKKCEKPANRKELILGVISLYIYIYTSSTAQGGGGSFKNRKPIGEVGCCESGIVERSHWWTERCLITLFLSLSLTIYLPTYLSIYLSLSLFHLITYLSIFLPTYLSIFLSIYLSINHSIYLSIHLSIYLSVCLSIYLSIHLSFYLSIYLPLSPSSV